MGSLFIAIIYLAFVSIGLPDSLLGSAWPVMHTEINASVSSAGVISMIISVCTIISALISAKLSAKIGAVAVTASSVFLTAAAMLAFSFAPGFFHLCLFAVPYGLGAGAIDSCLNSYVANHLSSKHMNWLHCCWGLGAMISPYIMGFSLAGSIGWRGGYRVVSVIQFILTAVIIFSVPLWKKNVVTKPLQKNGEYVSLSFPKILALPGTKPMFLGFFFYCAIEALPIVWTSTYFSGRFVLGKEECAYCASLFYIGLTLSRILCGFIVGRTGDKKLIRYGLTVVIVSSVITLMPFGSYVFAAAGFVLIGIGCGPVYPCIVHSAPENFGNRFSASVIGVLMASAYLGMTFTPLIFGKIAEFCGIELLPYCTAALAVTVMFLTERTNATVAKKKKSDETMTDAV